MNQEILDVLEAEMDEVNTEIEDFLQQIKDKQDKRKVTRQSMVIYT